MCASPLFGVADTVVEIKLKNPKRKAADIARDVGVSRERIRQILKKNGLCTRLPRLTNICINCGKPFPRGDKRDLYCSPECDAGAALCYSDMRSMR